MSWMLIIISCLTTCELENYQSFETYEECEEVNSTLLIRGQCVEVKR